MRKKVGEVNNKQRGDETETERCRREMGDLQDFISGGKRYIDNRSNGMGAEWGGMWFMWY